MKQIIVLLLPALLLVGCGREKPPEVFEAEQLKHAALKNAFENTQLALDQVVEGFRQSEYQRVEDAYQKDLEAIKASRANGKITEAGLIASLDKAVRNREENKRKVDAEIVKFKEATKAIGIDYANALELDAEIQKYYEAALDNGMKPADAQALAQQIATFIQKIRAKSDD